LGSLLCQSIAATAEELTLPGFRTAVERVARQLPGMMHHYRQCAEELQSEQYWEKKMDAVVGDRVNEVFLALQCRKHGLTSREYDQLRRKLLSTFALGEKKGRQEAEWKEELVGSLTKDYETEIEDTLGKAVEAAIFDEGRGESLKHRIIHSVQEVSKSSVYLDSFDFTANAFPAEVLNDRRPADVKSLYVRKGDAKDAASVSEFVKLLVQWFQRADEKLCLESVDFSGTKKFSDDALDHLSKLPHFPGKLSFLHLGETQISIDGFCHLVTSVLKTPDYGKDQGRFLCLKVGWSFWAKDQKWTQECNRWNQFVECIEEARGHDSSVCYEYYRPKYKKKRWTLHIYKGTSKYGRKKRVMLVSPD